MPLSVASWTVCARERLDANRLQVSTARFDHGPPVSACDLGE